MADPNPFMKFPIGDDNYVTIVYYNEQGKPVTPSREAIDMLIRYMQLMHEAISPKPETEPREDGVSE